MNISLGYYLFVNDGPVKDKSRLRPWLTIPETQRLTRKGREWVEARIQDGDFMAVKDGERLKVLTRSVREYFGREAAKALTNVGYPSDVTVPDSERAGLIVAQLMGIAEARGQPTPTQSVIESIVILTDYANRLGARIMIGSS